MGKKSEILWKDRNQLNGIFKVLQEKKKKKASVKDFTFRKLFQITKMKKTDLK